MSENNISWFHCGRCGSLFQSPPGESDDRYCPSCGSKPSLGIEAISTLPQTGDAAVGYAPPLLPPLREKIESRKRKQSYFMVKLVTAWVLVLLAIIFGAKWLWPEDAVNPQSAVQKTVGKQEVPPEDLLLLNDAIPACSQTFSAFLTSGTPEERNQYLLNPMDTAARMSRFYTLNPLVNIDPAKLSLIANAVLHLPNDRAIETQWKSSDGRLFDAVFVKQKGEWLLDWDYYIRYSDYPWALFLAGSGGETGEFRLLARERLADERKNADSISIVLYAPRFGDSNSTGFASPEFLIPRESKNGRLLEAAFKLEKSGKRSFGVSLPGLDPEGHIRVRVKVRRSGELTEHRYELEDVVACHWYSVDAPGVEISAPSSSR